uniref:CDP-diacylglycerol--glycerol-3-phosphate 3-phosphatidyltransferase n=1 Tax=Setaria digitata TaxID=48799 RepID=A0A915PNA5_9BILA
MDEKDYDTLNWLPQNAPYVDAEPEMIKVIETPTGFYEKLLVRYCFSLSLVEFFLDFVSVEKIKFKNKIGSKILRKHHFWWVNELEKALDTNPEIKIAILLDCLRGTRSGSEASSAQILVPRASVYLFHTPHLRGLKKRILPERVNEVVGLQHMKLLVFDNHIIFTGANLSKIYFTNRQDRYILIENCVQLADFVDSLVKAVGSCSFMLNMRGSTNLAKRCDVHPFKGCLKAYTKMLHSRVMSVVETLKEANSEKSFHSGARIYPLIQMGIASINQEYEFLKNLLSIQNDELSITMSSGYFNLTDHYIDLIANKSCYKMDVVYASPQANGFHQASGLFGFIPLMYVYISRLFYKVIRGNVRLFEYSRQGWSYHAKGLWINPKKSSVSATVIGSSNFGHRSVHRDLEAQFLIVMCNERLKMNLEELPFVVDMVLLQGLVFGRALMESLSQKGVAPATATVRLSHRIRVQRRGRVNRLFKRAITNPYETNEMLQRLGRCSVRHLSSGMSATSSSESLEEFLKGENWIPVYRFHGIHYSVLASKIKLALTVSSVALLPYKYWQYLHDTISINHLAVVSAFASCSTLAFIFFCRLFNRLIGVISMNETNEYVRIGYLSFWGSRCNKYMKLEDVIPLTESNTGVSDKIMRLQQYSSNEILNLPMFNVELLDSERATLLFGDTNLFSLSAKKME